MIAPLDAPRTDGEPVRSPKITSAQDSDTAHWNNLLRLFITSHFSYLCCAKNLSLLSCITERVAKRMQEQSEENRVVSKSRPMVMNLTSSVATSSSSVDSPIASRSPGILKASRNGQNRGKRLARLIAYIRNTCE